MRKFFCVFISFLVLVTVLTLINSKPVYAEFEKFATEHDITYNILPTGETQVQHNISITNVDGDVIATNYSLILNLVNISNEEGLEGTGKMAVKKETQDNTTILKAFFSEPAVGKGSRKTFTIKYTTKDMAYKVGEIWNINIPKSDITSSTTLYNVKVNIPKEFGKKIFISPTPSIEKEEIKDFTSYYFTKEDLLNSGISAAFGKEQYLNFKLKYQLENQNLFPSTHEIALPPDIQGSQEVTYSLIDPAPKKTYIDKDGNTIAQFLLKSKEKLEIKVFGAARITAKQIQPEMGGKVTDLPKGILNDYTKNKKYWETNDKTIQDTTKSLYNKDLNVSQNAQNIFNFVKGHLTYDTNAEKQTFIERRGAKNSIQTKDPVACMEFTDLFVALMRAAKLPAREVNGYAVGNVQTNTPISINLKSGDLLHSWAEYYDPEFGWVQVDPTWASTSGIDYFTKLDTNHFAFVVRGMNSEYPLPAGMYRFNDNEKLIEVDFANNSKESDFTEKISVKRIFNWNIFYFFLGYQKYEVKNTGNVTVYEVNGNKTILPNQKASVYLPKDETSISYTDFNGNFRSVEL